MNENNEKYILYVAPNGLKVKYISLWKLKQVQNRLLTSFDLFGHLIKKQVNQ